MALKTQVIVNSITNLSDARYCAGMGVAMIGFELNQTSDKYINPQTFKVITEWVSGVKTVGELSGADAADLAALQKNYTLDYLQIENSSEWKALYATGTPLICKVWWENDFTAASFFYRYEPIKDFVTFFLIDSSQQNFDKHVLAHIGQIAEKYPVILGFGVHPHNIDTLLANTSIKGIALKGSPEIKPGLKDFEDLAAILEAIETED